MAYVRRTTIHGASKLLTFTVRAFSVLMSPPSTAIVYDQYGPPGTVTRVVELPPVEIKYDDVCVRMLASPINVSDINRIEGSCGGEHLPQLPTVGGSEGVGEVHSFGSAVRHLSPGDWVLSSQSTYPWASGTWQTYCVNKQSLWHKIDRCTPMEYAATVTGNPLMALGSLEYVNLEQGDSIVQNGAISIVGQCIIQLARERGIHTINIIRTGSYEEKEKLKELGADVVLAESQLPEVKNVERFLGNIPEPTLGFDRDCDALCLARTFFRKKKEGAIIIFVGISQIPSFEFEHVFKSQARPLKVSSKKWQWKLNGIQFKTTTNKRRNMIDHLLRVVREGKLVYNMELVPFHSFHTALDKAIYKSWSPHHHEPTVLIF